MTNAACPLYQSIGCVSFHIGNGHFGNKDEETVPEIKYGRQGLLQNICTTEITPHLIVPVASQQDDVLFVIVRPNVCEMQGQVRSVQHNLAFLTNQVRKIDIDKDGTGLLAVLRIPGPTLPRDDVAGKDQIGPRQTRVLLL